MHIAIIGRGRLARTLVKPLRQAHHTVTLLGRDEAPSQECDLRWILVPDREIAGVAQALPHGSPVVHASGASGLDLLAPHLRRGSLHPLMTFPGPEISVPPMTQIPAAVDATDDALRDTLVQLAHDLNFQPFAVPGDRRLYHAAAVMAGNFGTVLLALAAQMMSKAGVPLHLASTLLAPLALESLRNAADDPKAALTGPAARGDHAVLDAHRAAMTEAGLADLLPIYDAFVTQTFQLLKDTDDR